MTYPGGGPANPGGGGNGIPGGNPGGLNPGGGPDMPGGAKGIGGRAKEGIPTKGDIKVTKKMAMTSNLLGGIIPIPRPAGIPRPGPTGS